MDEKTTTGSENNQDEEIQDIDLDAPDSDEPTDNAPAQEESNKSDDSSEDDFPEVTFEEESDDDKSDENDSEEKDGEEKSPEQPKFDEDLDEWATKTGRPVPTTDAERKTLQELRDSQREFHERRQAEKGAKDLKGTTDELKKEVADNSDDETIDPLEREVKELKQQANEERTLRLQSEFYQENNISESTGKLMTEVLTEMVNKATTPEKKLAALDYWGHPDQLPNLLELARAREITTDRQAVSEEAARKERERLAKESKENGPSRMAKRQEPAEPEDDLMKLWSN